MGNCFSYCTLEPHEYEQLEHIVTDRRKQRILNKERTHLHYDSCVF